MNPNNNQSRSRKPKSQLQADGSGSYLTSLKQLDEDQWKNDSWDHYPRLGPSLAGSNRPECRLMICHDMKGGYKEDVENQGLFTRVVVTSKSKLSEKQPDGLILPRYFFQYWHLADYFIYFSHHRITIPPLQWRAAARRNKTPILGTFITEWEEGISENERLLQGPNEETSLTSWSHHYADKLVEIAYLYGLDGWFMNFESPLEKTKWSASQLAEFLQYLRQKMHEKLPGSMVIWYDSLTAEGKIDWQNCLNCKNDMFFPVSDGFFTNYTWKEGDPKTSVESAKNRSLDVYTGIDLWGRKTYGGGGFDTYKALAVIKSTGTSCALFAPAWTYEHFGSDSFLENDERLWVGSKEQSDQSIQSYFKERQRFTQYFYTSFNCGYGQAFYVNGSRVHPGPWHHIGLQSPSPSQLSKNAFKKIGAAQSSENYKWKYHFDYSFSGGSCLRLWQFGSESREPFWAHLFELDMKSSSNFMLKVTYKSLLHGERRGGFGIVLRVQNLQPSNTDYKSFRDESGHLVMIPIVQKSEQIEWDSFETTINFNSGAVVITACGLYVESTGVVNLPGWFAVADIGELSIASQLDSPKPESVVKKLHVVYDSLDCVENENQRSVSLALHWDQVPLQYDLTFIDHWNIYANDKWIGVSLIGKYWVDDLQLPTEMDEVCFTVEAVDVCGRASFAGKACVPFDKTWTVVNPYK